MPVIGEPEDQGKSQLEAILNEVEFLRKRLADREARIKMLEDLIGEAHERVCKPSLPGQADFESCSTQAAPAGSDAKKPYRLQTDINRKQP